eukprot:7388406-Prymnesium_polylepis.1
MQLELRSLGFSTHFESMAVHVPADKDQQWADIKRKYFFSDTYYLPHCVLDGGAAAAASEAAEAAAA